MTSTAQALRIWEAQSGAAERLCADVLHLEGFEKITPQAPMGGPDGGKDILCEKDGVTFVAACHFSTKDLAFTASRTKFKADLKAALKHKRDGFIFMTNQALTPGERETLEGLARASKQRCLIHNREYLRVVLDSPRGYGLRLRHLQVALTPEEQSAFFAQAEASTATALAVHTRAIDRLTGQIALIGRSQLGFMTETVAVVMDAARADGVDADAVARVRAAGQAAVEAIASDNEELLSARLTPGFLRYVHRLLMPADSFGGEFRQTAVSLRDVSGRSSIEFECPSWDKVPGLVTALVVDWNSQVHELLDDKTKVTPALARFFQELCAIHPFTDGNGRLARALLSLQTRELLGVKEDLMLDRGVDYSVAIATANSGDFNELEALIAKAIQAAAAGFVAA